MRTFGNAIPGGQNEPTGNYQGRTDLVDLQNGYAVIDLEMAGEDPRTGLIIEMAVGVLRPGQNLVTDRVLVKIDRPIPESIVRLTGITDRDLAAGGIPIDDALGWFAERTSGLPLVGHNVLQSDRAHLVEAARRHRQAVEEGLYPKLVIDEMLDLPAQRFIDTAGLYKGLPSGRVPAGWRKPPGLRPKGERPQRPRTSERPHSGLRRSGHPHFPNPGASGHWGCGTEPIAVRETPGAEPP